MILSNIARNVRYRVKPELLYIIIELPNQATLKLEITNCSITGIRAQLNSAEPQLDDMHETGDIINSCKIQGDDFEISVGRLVLRAIEKNMDYFTFRFSLIDEKLPIEGKLSKFISAADGIRPHDIEISPYKFDLSTFIRANDGSTDLFSRCYAFKDYHKQWMETPLYLYNVARLPSSGSHTKLSIKRRSGRNDFIEFASNDYLNMAAHPKVKEAAKKAIDQYGYGPTGSPILTGSTQYHEELSFYLAKIFKKEKCLLFNSGYAVNAGVIPALTRDTDLILADYLSHASINHGIESSKAKCRYFKHNNFDHLDKLLKIRDEYSGCLIVTEGVFSMDGDMPYLPKLTTLAKENNARILLDEAHSFGIVGENGHGAAAHYKVLNQVDMIGGTLSKVAGSAGGFIAADAAIIDWLTFYSKTYMFSVAMPPSSVAAALTALKVVFEEEFDRVENLRSNIKHFIAGLKELGEPTLSMNHVSGIISITIGDEHQLAAINQQLIDYGIRVTPIVYPAVPRGQARFRFCITTEHTFTDIDYVMQILKDAIKKTNFSFVKI